MQEAGAAGSQGHGEQQVQCVHHAEIAGGRYSQHSKVCSVTRNVGQKTHHAAVECVVRNQAAGSMCRRLGVKEGAILNPPTFEFFLKDDSLVIR